MPRILISLFMLAATCWSFAQSSAAHSTVTQSADPQYQVGTIMDVRQHQAEAGSGPDVPRYDVSVRVVNTDYVVLFTPPYGGNTVQYKAGQGLTVLVGADTLTIRDIQGNKLEAPIIARKTVQQTP
jgi:hypothetical protein